MSNNSNLDRTLMDNLPGQNVDLGTINIEADATSGGEESADLPDKLEIILFLEGAGVKHR
jgi:hypothetical protein